MNSALQCLANNKFLLQYFVETKQYKKQMNMKSKMGFNGMLAQSFAELVNYK